MEVWQRNEPIEGLAKIYQPLAFALLEIKEEIAVILNDESIDLYERTNGAASIAFHLKHIAGVLDRMATYALGRTLDSDQLTYLSNESKMDDLSKSSLIHNCFEQIDKFIEILKTIPESVLFETRYLGRQKLPLTCWGLVVHGVEHSTRHLGQIIATVKCR